jgi:hypothetical protein
MKKMIFLIVLLFTFCTYSCKKSTSEQSTGPCRLLQSSGSLNEVFCYYDDHHNISKMMFISPPNDTGWENYYYNNGHVVYMIRLYKGTKGDTIFYTFNSGKYTEVNQYGYMQKYYYDNSGLLIKIERYDSTKVTDYSDFIYDSRGNCIKCTEYTRTDSAFEWSAIEEFEFGNSRNPYSSIGLPPLNSMTGVVGQYLSPNNITKWRYQYPQTSKLVLVYKYSSFNNNGYPVSFSIGDSLNHVLSNETIEYVCP